MSLPCWRLNFTRSRVTEIEEKRLENQNDRQKGTRLGEGKKSTTQKTKMSKPLREAPPISDAVVAMRPLLSSTMLMADIPVILTTNEIIRQPAVSPNIQNISPGSYRLFYQSYFLAYSSLLFRRRINRQSMHALKLVRQVIEPKQLLQSSLNGNYIPNCFYMAHIQIGQEVIQQPTKDHIIFLISNAVINQAFT